MHSKLSGMQSSRPPLPQGLPDWKIRLRAADRELKLGDAYARAKTQHELHAEQRHFKALVAPLEEAELLEVVEFV